MTRFIYSTQIAVPFLANAFIKQLLQFLRTIVLGRLRYGYERGDQTSRPLSYPFVLNIRQEILYFLEYYLCNRRGRGRPRSVCIIAVQFLANAFIKQLFHLLNIQQENSYFLVYGLYNRRGRSRPRSVCIPIVIFV